ncbi:phosphorylcholine transferase LicD [Adlercreutzia sp. ZJ473]|uniref:LicD family protein n=1 Tax=Adlercreutzia sp. ZJ473 TaxID=2722822 RepID=UPI0015579F8B|nr:LicD family protein [Adlercreutzia sp. ZJ473]
MEADQDCGNVLRQLTLQEIQTEAYRMLCEFDDVCASSGLTYSLAYGTLLGAVRHAGFIPWDDDIDIVMTRPEYDRLITLAPRMNECRLVEGGNGCLWVKIVSERTSLVDRSMKKSNCDGGVFIDVFPLDGVRSRLHYQVCRFLRGVRNSAYVIDFENCEWVSHKGLRRVAGIAGRIIPERSYDKLIYRFATACPKKGTQQIANMFSAYGYEKECTPINGMRHRRFVDFEGRSFPVLFDSEQYLERVYGKNWSVPVERPRQDHGEYYWIKHR